MYVIETSMKDGIERLKEMVNLDKNNAVLALLEAYIEFICNHQNFAIALEPIKRDPLAWIPRSLYKYEKNWRRVVLENVNCMKCDWEGLIANPTVYDLYITLENPFDILKEMDKLHFCKCPKCGGEISRQAIWIET